MVTAFSSIAVNNMNKGERSDIDINSSDIKPVSSSLTTKILTPASNSSTLTNKSPPTTTLVTPHSPSVPAVRHKDEEKRIQMVMLCILGYKINLYRALIQR